MRRTDISKSDVHPHLEKRMTQRGITLEEIQQAFNQGWIADDAKAGTEGKTFVFSYKNEWEGNYFEEKEVTIYYKRVNDTHSCPK